jgi:undecaprenyl-diphosphatase
MPEWVQSIDDEVLAWFGQQHTKFLDINVSEFTTLGGRTLIVVFSALALGVLLLAGQCRKALFLAVLLVATSYATQGIKEAVARPRPPQAKSHSKSFPSSHASLSMALFGMLALCVRGRAPARLTAYALFCGFALAVLVGLSRLYLGKHYLSDVLCGWLVGLVFVIGFYFLGLSRGSPYLQIPPLPLKSP